MYSETMVDFQELENEKELTTEVLNTYFLLEDKKEKARRVLNLHNFLEADNREIDNEIERLQKLKKSNDKKIESTKNYLLYLYKEYNIKQIGLFKLAIRQSTAIEVDNINVDDVEDRFLNIKQTKTISKEKIKEFLHEPAFINQDTGEVVPNKLDWAREVVKDNLIIK